MPIFLAPSEAVAADRQVGPVARLGNFRAGVKGVRETILSAAG